MYGETALKLIRDCRRNPDHPSPYQEDSVRAVIAEIKLLFNEVHLLINEYAADGDQPPPPIAAAVAMHSLAVKRSKRCLLAYHNHRVKIIKELVWTVGSIPPETKLRCSPGEIELSVQYRNALMAYRSEFLDLDLTAAPVPPGDVFVEVRVVKDCGEILTESGTIRLAKGTQHYVRRTDVEQFITQGYLKHVE
ncbi:hypothetical protein SeMB42_g00452 [Synchytrium endobioticum]|uniref:DNA replication complex GINS protein PSF1 n=1 Tax=Synchytrium endobioticum TaxID=286115 RepID=A0A507DIB8_9FUNG|nr:hypothetical protein SeLEV6574_g00316 [Synchytrium endobioticum]TPX54089.1 hypothetical protein SeMB42_g00452 [Synchytrium endobioticum]